MTSATNGELVTRVTDVLVMTLFTVDVDDDEREWVETNVTIPLIKELGLRRDEEQTWVTLEDDRETPHPCRRVRWVTEWTTEKSYCLQCGRPHKPSECLRE